MLSVFKEDLVVFLAKVLSVQYHIEHHRYCVAPNLLIYLENWKTLIEESCGSINEQLSLSNSDFIDVNSKMFAFIHSSVM